MPKIKTHEEFVKDLVKKRGEQITTVSRYKGSKLEMVFLCKDHGEFNRTPNQILSKQTCPQCGPGSGSPPTDPTEALDRVVKAHPTLTFPKFKEEYRNSLSKVTAVCSEHGPQKIRVSTLNTISGCPKCAIAEAARNRADTKEEWVNKCKEKHGDIYDYSMTEYVRSTDKVNIICNRHGAFIQNACSHSMGVGCPECFNEKRKTQGVVPYSTFVSRASEVHNNFYTYSDVGYIGVSGNINIMCSLHGPFSQRGSDHLAGSRCPLCAKTISLSQIALLDILSEYTETISNYRYGVRKKEIDIYMPEFKIGIEYNGVYWHSTEWLQDSQHLVKHLEAQQMGFRVIQIFSDEWETKPEAVLNHIRAAINKQNSVECSKLKLVDIKDREASDFHSSWNIHDWSGSGTHKGLMLEGVLIAVMTMTGEGQHQKLSRYSSSMRVIGGPEAMFSNLVKQLDLQAVEGYSDNRLSSGELFQLLGFEEKEQISPDFTYTHKNKGRRISKFEVDPENLVRFLGDLYNPSMTQDELFEASGHYKVFDCGLTKWIWKAKE